jgi:uncharacterized membrane protein YcaP (DUF421 family)
VKLVDKILNKNLESTNLNVEDLIAKIWEANVIVFDKIKAVVLESIVGLSVLHTNSDKKMMEKMLDGVRGD